MFAVLPTGLVLGVDLLGGGTEGRYDNLLLLLLGHRVDALADQAAVLAGLGAGFREREHLGRAEADVAPLTLVLGTQDPAFRSAGGNIEDQPVPSLSRPAMVRFLLSVTVNWLMVSSFVFAHHFSHTRLWERMDKRGRRRIAPKPQTPGF